MSFETLIFTISEMLAGIALFLTAMFLMSTSLQKAGKSFIKNVLYKVTKNPLVGFSVGTGLSTLIHSGPVVVMLVSFINVGLLNLSQSLGVILGANVGTTLSMQLVSLDIGKYCFFIIGIAYAIRAFSRKKVIKHVAECFFGLGLLFLGLILMKGSVAPLKDAGFFLTLTQSLEVQSFTDTLILILASTVLTAIMQSSGAMVAIVFSLCLTGVFTDCSQFFPIILGSHIGTCVVSFIGAIGASLAAKRAAYAHLFMNLVGVSAALVLNKFFIWIIPLTSTDLVHQAANYHTLAQTLTALLFLPFTSVVAKFIIKLSPDTEKERNISELDDTVFDDTKKSITSVVAEIRRMVSKVMQMFQESMKGLLDLNTELFYEVRRDERDLNLIQRNVLKYLYKLAEKHVTSYETMLIHSLMTAATDIERIGDHIESLTKLTVERLQKNVWFEESTMLDLMELYRKADNVLFMLKKFFSPSFYDNPRKYAEEILKERDEFVLFSREIRQRFNEKILEKKETALAGVFFYRYVSTFSKLVRHTKTIVLIEAGALIAPKIENEDEKFQE